MANACLNSYSSSSSSSTLLCKNRPTDRFSIPSSSSSLGFPISSPLHCALASSVFGSQNKLRVLKVLAITKEEVPVSDVATTPPPAPVEEEPAKGDESNKSQPPKAKPCELYVCNIPRSCDIAELAQIFKPYGTIHSVEVSRNLETGISKGCGLVTMASKAEAKAAIAALDGSDVGGREMRVRSSLQNSINNNRINDSSSDSSSTGSSTNKKNLVFETPHKIYVGNLSWSVKPEDLRLHFSQFGTVVSARLVFDRKGGRNRVYGFLSFSKVEESDAAVASSGTEYRGRKLLVRAAVIKTSETVESS